MKITDISVTRYGGDVEGTYIGEVLIVHLSTDREITGIGFTSAPKGMGGIFQELLRTFLADAVIGQDPRLHDDLWNRMFRAIPRRGGEGFVRLCMSAIDFALWDIKAKMIDAPVSTLLGGHRPMIPTYANCAHHLAPDALARRAAEYVDKGHRALKIRGSLTHVSIEEATARVRAVREAIGADVKLMVDVNGTWDVDTAIQQLKAWEPYDVYWLEEPVQPEDIQGYRRVKANAGSTYVVGGEQNTGLTEFQSLIDDAGIDIIQPNAALTGGITDWLRIHAYATARGVPISPWNLQMVHLHMAAGLPNVKWVEYFMPDNALLGIQTRLFTGPSIEEVVTPEGIFLKAPAAPGLGLTLDPEMAERHLIAN
ncbi:mandelate racemase/muconate lactonizing enzyme family protein [Mesorhizobium microcysteis]|jgi:L-alanine-DL-glutamate epimerase-like enolase superfamily enzyme|uniref:Mandelate racemase/muconate lactonizing enzyme family protein n=1 Tax=Neoaquamicrobium microcysteis TaxID=2682781 RepID=A0A5D4H766_9HYPH|nr:mandelate racemase/muconate lactonizing enzyme family protein [Mesorhizobium microcysteis]TYR36447.1 mandelate racemase/muconate lactonizing enzyme family protein [Mesorhizobium microcysteis]